MNEKMTQVKQKLNAQIENSNLRFDEKNRMRRVLEGVFLSQNGRLYLERKPDFQKYITIARDNDSENYDFCIAEVMKNEVSGATEGRRINFPGLLAISDVVEKNKDLVESEIINSQNYRRMQEKKEMQENESTTKTPIENYTDSAKKAIEEATNIPSYQKQRAYDLMDLLAQMSLPKIYAERGDNYSKSIALREEKSGYGYHILTRVFDEYSGSTLSRDDTPISAVSLVSYVNEHRIELDKEMKSLKAKLPAKKESKKISDDEGR